MSGNLSEVEVSIELCREGAILPGYARTGDSGMDIYAAEDVFIEPGQTVIIPTGLKLAIPEGYEIQVRPRSGISLKTPLRIANSPGTIDSGYRDELGVIANNSKYINLKDTNKETTKAMNEVYTLESKGNKAGIYKIKKGDRIAQIVLQKVPRIKFRVVDSVKNIGEDRGGGFGSTGI